MRLFLMCFGIIVLNLQNGFAQQSHNEELQQMYQKDQQSRFSPNIDWSLLNKEDSVRRVRAKELIDSGKVITGQDHYHAAMVFQHGMDSVDYGKAVQLMKKAVALDSTVNKWLLAAAVDRELMSRNKPQIYGTQYIMIEGGRWALYTIDTTQVTDEERKAYRVETLAEQRIKEREFNLLPISSYHPNSKSIAETVDFIRNEQAKGNESTYNVSEGAINTFGYQLLNSGSVEDALEIFLLNTVLYSEAFNTHDSLGECLLKLGRKEEAIAAYQKSLELNPKNENAREVLLSLQE